MSNVLIEFTDDTKDADDNIVRAKGSRLRVDPKSARSFVEKKKVAKVVDEEAEAKAEAKKSSAPAPSPANPGGGQ